MIHILKWAVNFSGLLVLILLTGCLAEPAGETDGQTGQDLQPGINLVMSISSTGEVTRDIPSNDDAKVDILFLDAANEPIAGEIINISATSGTLSQASVLTGSDGRVSVTITPPAGLTSGTSTGTFTATPDIAGEEGETFREAKTLVYQFVASTNEDDSDAAAASVASLQFVSADPTILSLKGTGGIGYGEVSTLVFRVVNTENTPVGGAEVNFSLDTSVGGIALNKSSSITNTQGEVEVTVQSGSVATPVRVTASVTTPSGVRSVQSDLLRIATGIPDQNSFSLSVDTFAPEGQIDGETVTFTARLADRNNNPVPDGTVVLFTTEGGVIESSCETVRGVCSVTWTSQNPRPLDQRSTILAYAIGHESFYDANGSGVFDDGDTFDDLGEAFRDDDETGTFNPTINNFSRDEKLIDYDLSGNYSGPDGVYNGIPCNHSTDCPVDANNLAGRSNLLVNIGGMGTIIMASSSPIVHLYELLNGNSTCLDANGKLVIDGVRCQAVSTLFAAGVDYKELWVLIEDADDVFGGSIALCKTSANGDRIDGVTNPDDPACIYAKRQSAPTNSTISVSTGVGEILGTPPTEVPNQTGAFSFSFTVQSSDQNAEPVTDVLEVKVTTPVGKVDIYQTVTLTDPIN